MPQSPLPAYIRALFGDPEAAAQDRAAMAAQAPAAAQHLGVPQLGPQELALDAAQAAMGAPGVAAKVLGAGAVGATMAPTTTDSAPRLTREQLQRLEEAKQRAAIEAQTRSQGMQDQAAAERQRAQDALAAQQQQREMDMRFQQENEEAVRQREAQAKRDYEYAPFQQRYPVLSEAMPAIGAAAAFGIPYVGRIGNAVAQRMASAPWMQAIARGEAAKALPATIENVGERAASRGELNSLLARESRGGPLRNPPPQVEPLNPWLKRAGMAAGVEGAMVQPEYNAAMLPSDSPDKYPDPKQLMTRLLMAGAAGYPPATIGSHLPVPVPPVTVPVSRIEGLAAALKPPPPVRGRASKPGASRRPEGQ